MITIFTSPKPFTDRHINMIQRNAIKSWSMLKPKPEIIIVGDEEGTEEVCKEFSLKHIKEVEKNKYGTPILRSIFGSSQKIAKNSIMCYINCDIILMNDFIIAVKKVLERFDDKFLIIGQRWDVDIDFEINFNDGWEEQIRNYALKKGKLHPHTGIDFFVFRKGQYMDIPPLIFARCMWDNWLVYKAKKDKIPVIDVTESATIIHQNHDYSHLRWSNPYKNPESIYNLKLVGGYEYAYTVIDANYKLEKGKIVRKAPSLYTIFYKIKRKFKFYKLKRFIKNIIYG